MSGGNWVTINGVHVLIGADGKVSKGPANLIGSSVSGKTTSKKSKPKVSDETKRAVNSWGRNASDIRRASRGEKPSNSIHSVSQQSVEKSRLIENFIQEKPTVKKTIYRGVKNLSESDLRRYTTVGSVIDQKGTSSWTTDKGAGVRFAYDNENSILFVQKGSSSARRVSDALGLGTMSEREVLMSSSAKQKVTGVEHHKNYTKVFVEEINKHK